MYGKCLQHEEKNYNDLKWEKEYPNILLNVKKNINMLL